MKLQASRRQPSFELLEDRCVPAGFIAVGTDAGTIATVRIFADRDDNNTYESLAAVVQPFAGFKGGARVALGDFDGDGNDELVAATGPGTRARVIVWDLESDGRLGAVIEYFSALGGFKGGLFVATGDLDGDGRDELVVSTDKGKALVKVFSDVNRNGLLSDELTNQFAPFGNFKGGVRVALGDTNNVPGDELIVGQGPGGKPRVMVFTDANHNRAVSDEPALESFLAYEAKFKGGVFVAAGRIGGAGNDGAEIIVGPGSGRAPQVKIFTDANNDGRVSPDPMFDSYLAYKNSFKGGVRVAAGDTDISGSLVEVISVPGAGLGPRVVIRDDIGFLDAGALLSDNAPTQDLAGYGGNKGAFVAFGKVTHGAFAYAGPPVLIEDLEIVTSTIIIAPPAGKIVDVDISLNIAHTFNGDLKVTLTHVQSGISVVLFTEVGGPDDGFDIRLNDEAAVDLGTTNDLIDATTVGTFNPEGAALLSSFDGLDASGDWVLSIKDDDFDEQGQLLAWSLDFTF